MNEEAKRLKELLSNRQWRLNNLYFIKDKTGRKIRFKMNWAQQKLYNEMHYFNVILKARQLGFCLDPSTRVLTADLKWVAIKDLKVGQEIVGVDEFSSGGRGSARKMKTATIQGVVSVYRDAYKITFDDGRSVVCTSKHPWLSRKAGSNVDWRKIEDGRASLTVGTYVRHITTPWDEPNYEDGWFSGIIDGEGSISKSNSPASINVSQKPGHVWDRINKYLCDRGYNFRIEDDKKERKSKFGRSPVPKAVIGRMNEMFRLIGQTRPSRFINNKFWEGRELPGKKSGDGWAKIIKIEKLPDQEMIDLQTSSGTYIAEGFVSHNTTFVMIYFLDACLFNSNHSAGVIAHTRDDAEDLFTNKVKFAYDNLPEWLLKELSAETDSAKKLVFKNGSSITVGTSLRSGTYQKLLISEYGKVSAKFPEKAREIKTGALNTVEVGQQVFVESTAEGKTGEFFDLCERARKLKDKDTTLTRLDPKFHFFAWFDNPDYRLTDEETDLTVISSDLQEYFEKFPFLDRYQKAWYAAKESTQGDDMRREFPSTPAEAFEGSLEGAYYTKEMALVRSTSQITNIPYDRRHPVYTFWDLGKSRDMMSIIFYQFINNKHLFIDYHESNGQGWDYYANLLRAKDYNYASHEWPHDGNSRIVGREVYTSKQLAEQVGIRPINVVPMTKSVHLDIMNKCKPILPMCWFDESKCSKLIQHLDNYRKKWDRANSMWLNEAQHDEASHAADAFRTFACAFRNLTSSAVNSYYGEEPEYDDEYLSDIKRGQESYITGY